MMQRRHCPQPAFSAQRRVWPGQAWRRASSPRPARTWRPWRRITRRPGFRVASHRIVQADKPGALNWRGPRHGKKRARVGQVVGLCERGLHGLLAGIHTVTYTLSAKRLPCTRNRRWASKLPLGLTWKQLRELLWLLRSQRRRTLGSLGFLDVRPRPREKVRKKATETSSEAACQKPLRKHLYPRLHDADVHGKRNCILLTRTAALHASEKERRRGLHG